MLSSFRGIQNFVLKLLLSHQQLCNWKVTLFSSGASIVICGNVPKLVKPDCSHRSAQNANLPRDLISTKPELQLPASYRAQIDTRDPDKKSNTDSETWVHKH